MRGKDKQSDVEPCHAKIRPIVVDTPQNDEGGRGVATESGRTAAAGETLRRSCKRAVLKIKRK